MTSFKRRERRPTASGPSGNQGELPWGAMFRDYGLSVDLMPKTPPPARSSGYGPILEWVIGKSWEMEEHVSLAIDIWRGTVDPVHYSVGDRAEAPEATKPSRAALESFANDLFVSPTPDREAAPKPAAPKTAAQATNGPGPAAPPARQRRRFSPGPA